MDQRSGKQLDYSRLEKTHSTGSQYITQMWTAARRVLVSTEQNTLRVCPLCSSRTTTSVMTVNGFTYRQCRDPNCRHVFVATLISPNSRRQFFAYCREYSTYNYCDVSRMQFRIDHIARPKVEHIMEYLSRTGGRWLDIGCGSGEVLSVVQENPKWEALGLELSETDAAFGRERLAVDIRASDLDDWDSQQMNNSNYDVVSLFGVLHCVADPIAVIQRAKRILRDDGIIAVELTNHDSAARGAVETFPDQPTRSSYNGITTIHHFTRASASKLFEQCGLKPVSMWNYGSDSYEIVNQLCFFENRLAKSSLVRLLENHATEIQAIFDSHGMGSNTLWVAQK